jgi:hypothetical protein
LGSWGSGPIFDGSWGSGGGFTFPSLFGLEFSIVGGDNILLFLGGGFVFLFFLLFDFFLVSVEEEIWHDAPLFASAQASSKSLDFSGQKPVNKTDTVGGLVVARDADIDVLDWGVSVAQRNDWNVDVAGLSDGLVVNSWIGDDDQPWLSEPVLGVIGETTWGESTVHGGSLDELGTFQRSSLSHIFGGNDADIGWVVDGGDDSGGQVDLFPHLLDVENVVTGGGPLEHVLVHLVVAVGATLMHLGGEDFPGIVSFELEGGDSVRHF